MVLLQATGFLAVWLTWSCDCCIPGFLRSPGVEIEFTLINSSLISFIKYPITIFMNPLIIFIAALTTGHSSLRVH